LLDTLTLGLSSALFIKQVQGVTNKHLNAILKGSSHWQILFSPMIVHFSRLAPTTLNCFGTDDFSCIFPVFSQVACTIVGIGRS
jgi:hypothetical protein